MGQIAWIFSIIPDGILIALIHITLIVGVVLSILGTFSSKFPFIGEYGRLAKLVGIPLFLLGIFLEGGLVTEMKWREQATELQNKIKISEERSNQANTDLENVRKEKVKVVTEVQVVIKERIKEVTKKIDADCKVDLEAIQILNDSAKLRKGTVVVEGVKK